MARIHAVEVENLDSTNVNPSHWTKLIHIIAKHHDKYDGIIITHGTDTMAYTASAVTLGLGAGLKIPIVFTGAQKSLFESGSDARFNLENSIKTVVAASNQKIAEVMIVFGERVMRACRAIKTSEARFPAFDSPAFQHLASITANGIDFVPNVRKKSHSRTSLKIKPEFERGIVPIDLVPGLEPQILLDFLKVSRCRGILLKSMGSGNVPNRDEYSLIPSIRTIVNQFGIPVLVSTKFVGGHTHMDMYEPGKEALDAGAIPTGDMTDVMAQIKFMWALAQGYNSPKSLRKIMQTNLVGEITASKSKNFSKTKN